MVGSMRGLFLAVLFLSVMTSVMTADADRRAVRLSSRRSANNRFRRSVQGDYDYRQGDQGAFFRRGLARSRRSNRRSSRE
ncbi:hypothetical protein ACOMHN_044092 [Nucella lapillus]